MQGQAASVVGGSSANRLALTLATWNRGFLLHLTSRLGRLYLVPIISTHFIQLRAIVLSPNARGQYNNMLTEHQAVNADILRCNIATMYRIKLLVRRKKKTWRCVGLFCCCCSFFFVGCERVKWRGKYLCVYNSLYAICVLLQHVAKHGIFAFVIRCVCLCHAQDASRDLNMQCRQYCERFFSWCRNVEQ